MDKTIAFPPKVVLLTHRRAEKDIVRLRTIFPSVRFAASTPENWTEGIADADTIFLGRGIGTDDVLARAPKLRWIHAEGAGVDRVLTDALRQSDVLLTNSSGVHGIPIAEHVLALIFAFARRLPALNRAQARHAWTKPEGESFELEGQTLAVIGLGAIGLTLARKAHGLGLRVLGVRRRPFIAQSDFIEKIFGIDEIDLALGQTDHIAICLPLTAATRGLFDDARFSRLRPGSYIYNIGRGAIINSEALQRALDSGRLAGAGLDVTNPEPLPPSSPFWDDRRVIITNHTSGGSPKNADRSLEIFRDNITRALNDKPLRNLIDKHEGY